jgi:hypothetical protein
VTSPSRDRQSGRDSHGSCDDALDPSLQTAFEHLSAVEVRLSGEVDAVSLQEVEDDEGHLYGHVPIEHASADVREVAQHPSRRRAPRRAVGPDGRPRSSGKAGVMFQPRRLRTARPSSVETSARNPSHLSSKDHPEPEGNGPGRDSIGSGSRSALPDNRR